MENGVHARVEPCRISRLPRALATMTPGMKLHKNGCLRHNTRTLPPPVAWRSSVDGLLTMLHVVSRLSPSPHNELPTVLARHVSFIQRTGKVCTCGDCELFALTTANAGAQIFASRFPQ